MEDIATSTEEQATVPSNVPANVPMSKIRVATPLTEEDKKNKEIMTDHQYRKYRKPVIQAARKAREKELEIFRINYLKTNGNITESARLTWPGIRAIDSYRRGHRALEQMVKHGNLVALMEQGGLTMGTFVDVLKKRVQESKSPEWWDRGMAMRPDGRDFLNQKSGNQVGIINIVEAQKKILGQYGETEGSETVEGEIIETEEVEASETDIPNDV